MASDTVQTVPGLRREAVFSLVYLAAYVGYLFIHQESELQHWITLVGIPAVLLLLLHRVIGRISMGESLASVGLRKGNLTAGLRWAIPLGLALGVLQLVMSRNSEAFWELLRSGRAAYLFPIALGFLLVATGFTEEFFFRGVLQTRLEALVRSKIVAVIMTSVLFGLYHVPYAYLNPHWPSHGDFPSALRMAMVDGALGGIVLGVIYLRSRHNLLACVIVHAMIDVFPAMTMIKFSGP